MLKFGVEMYKNNPFCKHFLKIWKNSPSSFILGLFYSPFCVYPAKKIFPFLRVLEPMGTKS